MNHDEQAGPGLFIYRSEHGFFWPGLAFYVPAGLITGLTELGPSFFSKRVELYLERMWETTGNIDSTWNYLRYSYYKIKKKKDIALVWKPYSIQLNTNSISLYVLKIYNVFVFQTIRNIEDNVFNDTKAV